MKKYKIVATDMKTNEKWEIKNENTHDYFCSQLSPAVRILQFEETDKKMGRVRKYEIVQVD